MAYTKASFEYFHDHQLTTRFHPDSYPNNLTPEENLLLNILYRACRDLFEGSAKLRKQARGWLENHRDHKHYITCAFCLQILEIPRDHIDELLAIEALTTYSQERPIGIKKTFHKL